MPAPRNPISSSPQSLIRSRELSTTERCLIVSNRLVRLQPSATSSDRNLKIKSRHSQQFYSYAGKLLEDELQLARLASTRTVDFKLAASLRHSFQPSRAGLLSSLSEVE